MQGEVRVPPTTVVIRFRPTSPEAVLRWAQKEHRRSGRHRLSVFAAERTPGEDDETLHRRLLDAAELSGIDPAGNRRYYVCTTASDLYDRGFTFHKDGYPGEPPEHYSIDLGLNPMLSDVERFISAFPAVEEWVQ